MVKSGKSLGYKLPAGAPAASSSASGTPAGGGGKKKKGRPASPAPGSSAGSSRSSSTKKKICKFYLQGNCKYGNACKFAHTGKPNKS